MIALGVSYETGILITGSLVTIGLLLYIIHVVYVASYNFIEEGAVKKYITFDGWSRFGNDASVTVFLSVGFGMLGSLAWPLVYPGLLIAGVLLLLRKFRRFQKKVDKALDKVK